MLTAQQLAFREGGIGGSDAKTIMYGDAEDWQALRAEKHDGVAPKFTKQQRRLMDMGHAMEPLCLQWFHEDYVPLRTIKDPVQLCRTWSVEPLFRCILDGETMTQQTPVQCKYHTGEKSIEELADYYLPQLQHEIMVTDSGSLWFAAVFGRWGAFKAIEVERDQKFIDAYQHRALMFQVYWESGKLPKELGNGLPRSTATVIRLRDHVWPAGDNVVGPLARDWLAAKKGADNLDVAARQLKAQFPDDAKSAKWIKDGEGVVMKKNRAGVISLTAV